jgi:hypothetical protein
MDIPNSDSAAKPFQKPRTDAQIAASRANGSKSKGPKTERGKATSSRNGLRHGLTSSMVVRGVESQRQFRDLTRRFHAEHRPVGVVEEVLVEEIAVAIWTLRRARRDQTTAWNEFYHDGGDYPVLESSSEREEKARKAFYSSMERLAAVQAVRKRHFEKGNLGGDGKR